MNPVVKIIRDHDGEKVDNPKWCLVASKEAGRIALCSGKYFRSQDLRNDGKEDSEIEYEYKIGKITCPNCIKEIKYYKSLEL